MTFENKSIRFHAYEMDQLTQALTADMNDGWQALGGPIVTGTGANQYVSVILTRKNGTDPAKIIPRVY